MANLSGQLAAVVSLARYLPGLFSSSDVCQYLVSGLDEHHDWMIDGDDDAAGRTGRRLTFLTMCRKENILAAITDGGKPEIISWRIDAIPRNRRFFPW
jgi:hypothetical protein